MLPGRQEQTFAVPQFYYLRMERTPTCVTFYVSNYCNHEGEVVVGLQLEHAEQVRFPNFDIGTGLTSVPVLPVYPVLYEKYMLQPVIILILIISTIYNKEKLHYLIKIKGVLFKILNNFFMDFK